MDEFIQCTRCGFRNQLAARFCANCAEPIDGAASSDAFRESRWLTVLFCDIVGWVRRSRELGDEVASDARDAYHRACKEIVEAHAGYFAQPLGDGALVYFGYPVAREDNAVRALRAALELVDTLPRLQLLPNRPDFRIAVRVAAHTGRATLTRDPMGHISAGVDVPNLASRLQAEAEPNTVVTSESTYRTTRGFFEFEDLGYKEVKGGLRIPLYRVLGVTAARSRSEVVFAGEVTPLVGRNKETGALRASWSRVVSGHSEAVLLRGDAGIGKSRLVHCLGEELVGQGYIVFRCSCASYDHRAPAERSTLSGDRGRRDANPDLSRACSPLHPIIELLEGVLALRIDDSVDDKLGKIERLCSESALSESAPRLLAALLSIPTGDRYPPFEFTGIRQRQLTFGVILEWLRAQAARKPVLFVIEDLHWADDSTMTFLGELLAASLPGLLSVLTARSGEFESKWGESAHLSELDLAPLRAGDAREIIRKVCRGKALPPEAIDFVMTKSEGVPLYLEEITKGLTESPDFLDEKEDRFELRAPIGEARVLQTLNDWLMTRLDRLGSGKTVAQVAAVLGREFRSELLDEFLPPGIDSHRELQRLTTAGLLLQQGATHRFKHALLQDAAYASVPDSARRSYHERIATTLRQRPTAFSAPPELVARHFARAGMSAEACQYWTLAGWHAAQRSAFHEAISAFRAGLEQLSKQPPSEARDRSEIELQSALGFATIQAWGWSRNEVEECYRRAGELCARYGDVPVRVHYGAWAAYVVRGEREATAALSPVFEALARDHEDPCVRLIAEGLLGGRAFWSGDYRNADPRLRRGKELVDRDHPKEQARRLMQEYGSEAMLFPHVFMAWSDMYQDRVKESVAGIEEALEIGAATAEPYISANAMGWAAALAHDLGDPHLALERASSLKHFANENGLLFWVAIALSVEGWAKAKAGNLTSGLELMDQAVLHHKAMGSRVVLPYYLSYIAETCVANARERSADSEWLTDKGLAAAEEGLEIAKTNLATHFIPELTRFKGELLLVKGERQLGVELLDNARTLADAQGALRFVREANAALERVGAA